MSIPKQRHQQERKSLILSKDSNDQELLARKHKFIVYFCSALAVCCFMYFVTDRSAGVGTGIKGTGGTVRKKVIVNSKTVGAMLEAVEKERNKYMERLKVEYGDEYFAKLFLVDNSTTSRGYASFLPPPRPNEDDPNKGKDLSRPRLHRKLLLKILSSLNHDEKGSFVWATGGHSAAAGHGNFANQSYTAVMERAVRPVFDAVSLNFVGRNFAMGGMPSGPELAPCVEAVFGLDADAITWDYGMTDVPYYWRKAWYTHRIALHPNRPMIVDLRLDGGHAEGDTGGRDTWTLPCRNLEDHGATAFYLESKAIVDMHQHLPDMFGLTQKQIDATPVNVRNFRCQEKFEKGDPFCWTDRFMKITDDPRCNMKGQVDWHPGWKEQALVGNLMAFFMIDNLQRALETLRTDLNGTDALDVLSSYQTAEDADYEELYRTLNVDENMKNQIYPHEKMDNVTDLIPEMFGANTTICHSVLLPSQTRYKGYLGSAIKNSKATNKLLFDQAIPIEEAKQMEFKPLEAKEDGKPRYRDMILSTPMDGHDSDTCPTLIQADRNDFMLTTEKMGWSRVAIPHRRYLEEYKKKTGREELNLKGLVMACSRLCPWGDCPKGRLGENDLGKSLELQVNGRKVEKMHKMGDNCYLLEGQKKYFGAKNDGSYHLQVNVKKQSDEYVSYFDVTTVAVM